MTNDPASNPLVDIHVHIVGNGSGNSDCWLRFDAWAKLRLPFMLRAAGLPQNALKRNFDELYAEKLAEHVRSSSLDHAVILAFDEVYDSQGRKLEDCGITYVPNGYVFRLSDSYPEFLPGVSIHPSRVDAMDCLNEAIERGAVLLKLLPCCQNVDCSDPQHIRFWERMAEAGLPLLAHTGGELSMPVIRPDLKSPEILELPLQCGVTVIAAHVGTSSCFVDPDFLSVFTRMLDEYPKLYGDLSALSQMTRSYAFKHCLKTPVVDRIVHGSDYPIPAMAASALAQRLIDRETYKKLRSISNPIERDYQIKREVGFSDEVFNRAWELLRKP